MRPESFHLAVGMTRDEALKSLSDRGWSTKQGDDDDRLLIDYADDKAVTLQFHKNRLRSIRFELYLFLPDARTAFAEEKAYLKESLGQPKKMKSKSVLLYDRILPNVMVVLSADPKSARYFQIRSPRHCCATATCRIEARRLLLLMIPG